MREDFGTMKFKTIKILPWLLLLWLLPTIATFGQTDDPVQSIIEQMSEIWTENDLSEDEIAVMAEELQNLSENPISLNDPTIDILVELKLITEFQKNIILKYRRQFGAIQTLSELSMIPEFTPEDLERLSYFVTTEIPETKPSLYQLIRNPKHEILSEVRRTIEKADGYKPKNDKPPAYPGSPEKIYARYRVTKVQNFSAGVTMEKDPGEEFFSGNRKDGFDFYSAHAYLKLNRIVNEIAVGDYTVNLGNGLTMGSGFYSGKSSQALTIKQNTTRIRRYSSATEYGFLRGFAASFRYRNLSAILFAAHTPIDVNLQTNTIENISYYSTIAETGLHRTNTELAYRNQGTETVVGGNVTLRTDHLRIGANFYTLQYGKMLMRRADLYRIHEPKTKNFINSSIDYQYIFRRYIFWGEAAVDKNGNTAFMQGLQIRTNDLVQLAFHYRDYSAEYFSPKAIAFGESSNGANERGFYAGILLSPIPRVDINAYADLFSYPWMTYRRYTPSPAYDYMVDAQWSPNRNLRISSRLRIKETKRNITNDTLPEYLIGDEKTTRLHFQADIRYSKSWSSQTRLATTIFKNFSREKNGWLMYHEMTYNFTTLPLRISARYVIFNVDSWDARIYTYEKDVLYAFSVPAFSGIGSRYYLVAKWQITPNAILYAKWSQTIYQDVWELSSDNDRIEGNTRSQIAFKLKITF